MRTCSEHIGNKEVKKEKRKTLPPPHLQRKKQGPSQVHVEPSHWLHEIFIFETVSHHFWPGLMAVAEIWGHSVRVLRNGRKQVLRVATLSFEIPSITNAFVPTTINTRP
jgi:hypothetical protein